jgi:hypothetical protein
MIKLITEIEEIDGAIRINSKGSGDATDMEVHFANYIRAYIDAGVEAAQAAWAEETGESLMSREIKVGGSCADEVARIREGMS